MRAARCSFPPQLLRGLLPDARVAAYTFWQAVDDFGTLVGEERATSDTPTRLRIALESVARGTSATVGREYLVPSGAPALEAERGALAIDTSKSAMTLVDLVQRPAPLKALLVRLEGAPQIHVWTLSTGSVDLVEMPPLRLSFALEVGVVFRFRWPRSQVSSGVPVCNRVSKLAVNSPSFGGAWLAGGARANVLDNGRPARNAEGPVGRRVRARILPQRLDGQAERGGVQSR